MLRLLEKLEPVQAFPAVFYWTLICLYWMEETAWETQNTRSASRNFRRDVYHFFFIIETDWCAQHGAAAFVNKPVVQKNFESVSEKLLSFCEPSFKQDNRKDLQKL